MKINRRILLGLSFCIVLILDVMGQADYRAGELVTVSGDTLRGQIGASLSEGGYNVAYRSVEKRERVIYDPSQLIEYRLGTGELYRPVKLWVGEDTLLTFIQCLVLGEVNLFTYTDDMMKVRYYIGSEENGMRELTDITEKDYDEEKGKWYWRRKKNYEGELRHALRRCPGISEKIEKVSLTRKSLIKIIEAYHECTGKSYKTYVSDKKEKGKMEYGVYTGVRKSLNIGDHDEDGKFFGYTLGGFVNYVIPNAQNRYSVEFGYVMSTEINENDIEKYTHFVPIYLNRYATVKEKFRAYYRTGIEFSLNGRLNRLGIMLGGGYEFNIGKLKIFNNVELKLDPSFSGRFSIGVKI